MKISVKPMVTTLTVFCFIGNGQRQLYQWCQKVPSTDELTSLFPTQNSPTYWPWWNIGLYTKEGFISDISCIWSRTIKSLPFYGRCIQKRLETAVFPRMHHASRSGSNCEGESSQQKDTTMLLCNRMESSHMFLAEVLLISNLWLSYFDKAYLKIAPRVYREVCFPLFLHRTVFITQLKYKQHTTIAKEDSLVHFSSTAQVGYVLAYWLSCSVITYAAFPTAERVNFFPPSSKVHFPELNTPSMRYTNPILALLETAIIKGGHHDNGMFPWRLEIIMMSHPSSFHSISKCQISHCCSHTQEEILIHSNGTQGI